jgi:hypothetical protein
MLQSGGLKQEVEAWLKQCGQEYLAMLFERQGGKSSIPHRAQEETRRDDKARKDK